VGVRKIQIGSNAEGQAVSAAEARKADFEKSNRSQFLIPGFTSPNKKYCV